MSEQLLSRDPATLLLTLSRVVLGPALAVATFLALPHAVYDNAGHIVSGLSYEGRVTASVGVLMAIWWLLEALPLSVTSLLPVTLLPVFGAVPMADAAAPYARDLLFLFFGGFMLGLAMERWDLHRRMALVTLRLVGTSPTRIVAGFMIATAVLSAWVSNTATAILMLPIATSVIGLVLDQHARTTTGDGHQMGRNFATSLLLGIAFSASIGGVATLIGTPPNLVLAAIVRETLDTEISMARWIMVAMPLSAVFLPIAWLVLTRVVFPIKVKTIPGAELLVRTELENLGPMKRGEIMVLIVFLMTAIGWIIRPQLVAFGNEHSIIVLSSLRDSSIALLASLAMFMIPVHSTRRVFIIDWDTVRVKMPWGILLLFGGGLSLAAAISSTGVDVFIGRGLSVLQGIPVFALLLIIATVMSILTGVTSNTALTTAVLPVLLAAAPVLGVDPMKLLLPATLAANFAFMLPVATPPNAIVFGSGRVTVGQMAKSGALLNAIGVLLAAVVGYFFSGLIVT